MLCHAWTGLVCITVARHVLCCGHLVRCHEAQEVSFMRKSRQVVAWALAAGFTSVAAAGCSGGGSDSDTTGPAALCEAALDQDIASATATTVGVIRHYQAGSVNVRLALHAFADASDDSPGAWCWVNTGSAWAGYGVGPDGTAVLFGNYAFRASGPGPAPSGPPVFF
jgi:hypothetical protein